MHSFLLDDAVVKTRALKGCWVPPMPTDGSLLSAGCVLTEVSCVPAGRM